MSRATRAADAPSEDVCAIPEAMRRLLLPRRGRAASAPLSADPQAATYLATWLDEHSAVVDKILDNGPSVVEVAKRFRACRGDIATATPLAASAAIAGVHIVASEGTQPPLRIPEQAFYPRHEKKNTMR